MVTGVLRMRIINNRTKRQDLDKTCLMKTGEKLRNNSLFDQECRIMHNMLTKQV